MVKSMAVRCQNIGVSSGSANLVSHAPATLAPFLCYSVGGCAGLGTCLPWAQACVEAVGEMDKPGQDRRVQKVKRVDSTQLEVLFLGLVTSNLFKNEPLVFHGKAVCAVGRAVLRSEDVDLADLSGVQTDRAGGLSALAVGVVGNSAAVFLMMRYLERLRRSNPCLYEGNMMRLPKSAASLVEGTVRMHAVHAVSAVPWGSKEMLQQKWGWLCAATALNIDDVEAAAGLDAAMMVEFADLSMQILAIIGTAGLCSFWMTSVCAVSLNALQLILDPFLTRFCP